MEQHGHLAAPSGEVPTAASEDAPRPVAGAATTGLEPLRMQAALQTQRTTERGRLNEYDRTEWLDIARKLNPGLTEAEYGAMWDRFERAKAEHERAKGMQ